MSQLVLALNAGSATLKFAVYRFDNGREDELATGTLETDELDAPAALGRVNEQIAALKLPTPSAVGHRLVHGGATFTGPVLVDDFVLASLAALSPLAPLHLPPALRLLRAAREHLPGSRHVACFDTAFHHCLPRVAQRLPLPLELHEQGIRRYGFHGLSYQYALSQLGSPPPARLVIAHLGSGASLCAIRDGESLDTTMAFTPSGGIAMGTRSGDLDPGVLLHLLRTPGYSPERLEQLINHESGLKGWAGTSNMAALLGRAALGDTVAHEAIEQFAYAIKKQIGAYAAVLGGLDCLVFTGGIGENAALVRTLSCSSLQHLGIELDAARNAQHAPVISGPDSRCEVRVVRCDENLVIARSAHALGSQTGTTAQPG